MNESSQEDERRSRPFVSRGGFSGLPYPRSMVAELKIVSDGSPFYDFMLINITLHFI